MGTEGFSTACAAAATSLCVAAASIPGDFAWDTGMPLGTGERLDIVIGGQVRKSLPPIALKIS